jgi:hypothetical protein
VTLSLLPAVLSSPLFEKRAKGAWLGLNNKGELRTAGRRDRVTRAHVDVDFMEDHILDELSTFEKRAKGAWLGLNTNFPDPSFMKAADNKWYAFGTNGTRFSNKGELRTAGRRDRVTRAHVDVDFMEDHILDESPTFGQ